MINRTPFPVGAQKENQWMVFDTCVDMPCVFVTSVLAAIILLVYLQKKDKKTLETAAKQKITASVLKPRQILFIAEV